MPRILFINTNISWNKGSAAQVAGVMKAIRGFMPDAEFSLISYCMHLDSPAAQHRQLRVVGYPDDLSRRLGSALFFYSVRLTVALIYSILWRFASKLGARPGCLARERYIAEYLNADVVIDLSGDSLSDIGSHPLPNFLGMLIAIILERPFVVYSQSIGPFSRSSTQCARFCLNRARAITVREHTTIEYLSKIGVVPGITYEFGDCAFAMDAESESRALDILRDEGIPPAPSCGYVGISVSALVSEISRRTDHLYEQRGEGLDSYLRLILKIVNHLTERGHYVILFSHVIAPEVWIRDDRAACDDVMGQITQHKDRVGILRGDYSPEELKAVISKCDAFIGSRMHACIAALSTNVPTVTLGWSHKYDGIMERLGMKEWSYAIQNIDEQALIDGIDDIVNRRKELALSYSGRIAHERESALEGAEVVRRILQTHNP